MRISAVSISNFRGIRRLELAGLESEPLIVVSGANGAGKSLVLEAIYLAGAEGSFGIPNLSNIGPWGSKCEVKLEVWLSPEERIQLQQLRDREMPQLEGTAPERIETGFSVTVERSSSLVEPGWAALLIRVAHSAGLSFGDVDYLPADRLMPRGEQAAIATEVLSDERRNQLRQQAHQSALNRNPFSLSGIQPVLATLDYLDLIAERASGTTNESDFDRLTSAFERATGKKIPRPVPDPAGVSGTRLLVRTPAGVEHSLDQLSSGEQAILGLMFYVRRLSSTGGVLLVDEPELHLHPALHSLLFTVLGDVAQRAQIWTVTHSTRVVATAPLNSLVHVRAASPADENQAAKARDDDARIQVLEDLGIDPAVGLQTDLLLVVEGESDRQLLRRLLPVETGRAQFVVTGTAERVVQTSRSLDSGYPGAWIAIRDRDLLDDAEVCALTSSDSALFVWPGREIENELLHPSLVALAFTRSGRRTNRHEAESMLLGLFVGQREQIVPRLVEARLRAKHSAQSQGGSSLDQLRAYLTEVQRIATEKLSDLASVEAEVTADLDEAGGSTQLQLLDGKRALGELVPLSPFERKSDLVDALVSALQSDPTVVPPGLVQLRSRILAAATEQLTSASSAR